MAEGAVNTHIPMEVQVLPLRPSQQVPAPPKSPSVARSSLQGLAAAFFCLTAPIPLGSLS